VHHRESGSADGFESLMSSSNVFSGAPKTHSGPTSGASLGRPSEPPFDRLTFEQRRIYEAAEQAARRIEDVRSRGDLQVQLKSDSSPVTSADLAAHEEFAKLKWDHLISEEALTRPAAEECLKTQRENFWLIDPLDGTRDLIRGELSFAIVAGELRRRDDGQYSPEFGLIWHPPTDEVWIGWVQTQELWSRRNGVWSQQSRLALPAQWRVLGSRGMAIERLQALSTHLGLGENPPVERLGSAIKFARLAMGDAEVYPRFGPTSEWDTAAGQALLEATGGGLWDLSTQKRLTYFKSDWENRGGFLALRSAERASEIVAEASRIKSERDRAREEKR